MTELDYPCRQTCSGWKQGYERGVKDGMERAAKIAEQPYGDEVDCHAGNEPSEVGIKIAAAIRAASAKESPRGNE